MLVVLSTLVRILLRGMRWIGYVDWACLYVVVNWSRFAFLALFLFVLRRSTVLVILM